MTLLAWIGLAAGVWILHSAIKGKQPLTDLKNILGGG